MILRSPPPKRATGSEPPAVQTPSANGSTSSQQQQLSSSTLGLPTSALPLPANVATPRNHTHGLSSSTSRLSTLSRRSPPGSISRRPENAQNDYWASQVSDYVKRLGVATAKITALEESKAKAVHELQAKLASERQSWQNICDILQDRSAASAAGKLVQWEYERERYEMRFEELTRDSQLAILQRDARIAEFQDSEYWLRDRVKDMEKVIENARVEYQDASTALLDQQESLQLQVDDLTSRLETADDEIKALRDYKTTNKPVIKQLRQKVASQQSEIEALSRTVDSRTKELKEANSSLSAATTDLSKLKKSDRREGSEMESLRQTKVDLELRIKALELDAKEQDKEVKKREKELVEQLQEAQRSNQDFQHQLNALETRLTQLSAKPPTVSTATKSAPKARQREPEPEPNPEIDIIEVDDEEPPRFATPSVASDMSIRDLASPPLPKEVAKHVKKAEAGRVSSASSSTGTSKAKSKASTSNGSKKSAATKVAGKRNKTPVTLSASDDDDDESLVKSAPKPVEKSRPKPRPAPKNSGPLYPIEEAAPASHGPKIKQTARESTPEPGASSNEVEEYTRPPSKKALGKRRAPDEGPGLKGLSPQKPPADTSDTKSADSRSRKRFDRETISDEVEEDEPRKKKKRVLGGGFGVTASNGSNWTSDITDVDGLGVPSMLSPVVNRPAPARSFSSQLGRKNR